MTSARDRAARSERSQPTPVRGRRSPIDMSATEFREIGHALVDRIAEFYESLPERKVTPGEPAGAVRARLGERSLPATGAPAARLVDAAADLLFDHSLHNGHPRFFGYITSSAAPLGALADLLAAAVNPNVGLWDLAPMASEIERQTVRWLAELVGYPTGGDGLMVSGGNTANLLAFVAARRARAPWDVRARGVQGGDRPLAVYASRGTHTWIEKAADVCGLGTDAIRWIETDAQQRLLPEALEHRIRDDVTAGALPFLVVGTAGNVSTGAVDPLPALAAICARYGPWLHVDGAYGAPATALPDASDDLRGLALADSVALDPHKWLYCPIEAGCTLVRDPEALVRAFRFRPPYYPDAASGGEERGVDHHERGLQNTRGFRALKVWLSLQHLGREGQVALIREDIALAAHLHARARAHPELEAFTRNLSITTFRYVPPDLADGSEASEKRLNALNERLLSALRRSGEIHLTNAMVEGRYLLRACIVNFRTTRADVEAVPEAVVRTGRQLHEPMRSS